METGMGTGLELPGFSSDDQSRLTTLGILAITLSRKFQIMIRKFLHKLDT